MNPSNGVLMLPIAIVLGLAIASFYVVMWVRRRDKMQLPILANQPESSMGQIDEPIDPPEITEGHQHSPRSADIEMTSEMAAVMETLTAREKAVMTALIENKGRMNQADIRYETNIPKSSLTGILLSLERRKLITKREKGRTNVIELTGRFLSRKEAGGTDTLAEDE